MCDRITEFDGPSTQRNIVNKIEIIPLGGIGEFGMNCMGIRYADEMIVVDVGMGFPEETPYGVDISVPDFDFLEEYRDDLLALILTHGHEDHIGATPYFLKKYNLPVYASALTLAFIDEKLAEHDLLDDILTHRVGPRDTVKIGRHFKVGFIHASHSLVECFSLAITTPLGTIIHTGDYKMDETPVIGKPYDLQMLGKYGEEGVLALLGDSTNATVPGRTPSEKDVIPDIADIFEETDGRLFFTTFSSSFHRLQIVFDLAYEFGKRVCVLGRSMLKNVEIGERLGLLKMPPKTLIGLTDSHEISDDEIVYLVTGSQGEQRAVMWNLATQSYKGLQIQEGDTVVLSARIIPGNEKRISKMIGAIYRRGGNIIEEKRRLIHVSGHASQEDIKIMVETAKPKFVIPVHGEYRMLFRHKEFVKNHLGYDEENVILIEDGDVLELEGDSARVVEQREIGRVFIDGLGLGEIEHETVRERKKLAYGGIVSLILTLDKDTKKLKAAPEIKIKGVAGIDPLNGTLQSAKKSLKEAFRDLSQRDRGDSAFLAEHLRIHLKRFIQNETGTKPLIVPTILEL